MFTGKTLLITGGTGSFGRRMTRHFLDHTDIGQVRVFSRDEEKQDRMRHLLRDGRVKYYIGDVRDPRSVRHAMKKVDFVFHAAALKQVPSCEFHPLEAVGTNVLGAGHVLDACAEMGVEKAVVLSTDKAVHPVNVMGMTKALMEKLMVAKSRNVDPADTLFAATRYGNVMASRGSVIPLFVRQCKENRPITVTDPAMTRFLMSLDESVALVLFAFAHARTGDTFVQQAPACTIGDLAEAVRRLFGAKNEIRVIGTRHGEKGHETLVNREEMAKAEDLGGFFRIPADTRDLNYGQYFDEGDPDAGRREDYTSANTRRLTVDEVVDTLRGLDYVQAELGRRDYVGVAH